MNRCVAASPACAVTSFDAVILSGRLLADEPELANLIRADLSVLGRVNVLPSLPGAWVKHAAQGAAVLADGLAAGRFASLVEQLAIRHATGTVLDWLHHPAAAACRAWFADTP